MKSFLVTSIEAGRLPRWVPLLFCAVYVVAGLFGRDPWRTDDAAGFGIAHTMATGSAIDWLIPNVHGALAPEDGPLPFWLGAIGIRLANVTNGLTGSVLGLSNLAIPPDLAMRAVAACGLALSLALLWYATYALARRPEIQPDDPFGAAASRTDFARAVADTALLAMLATFGILARLHETTGHATQVTWIALYLFGLAHTLQRPRTGALLVGLAIAATLLTRGIPLAAALALVTVVLSFGVRPYRLIVGWTSMIWIPVALIGSLAWPVLLVHFSDPSVVLGAVGQGDALRPVNPAASAVVADYFQQWLHWNRQQLLGPTLESAAYYAETLVWFYWPLWPFVIWAIWRWRGSHREAPIAVPAVLLVPLAILAALDPEGSEASLLPLVLPMTMLTALALPTVRRSVVSLIDWFAVMTFSVVGLVVWAYWIAFMTGFPPRMAEKAQNAVPGFTASLSLIELGLGLAATAGWIWLVFWRISRQPRPFWRPMALSSGGMVLAWLLLMTLWLPAGNFRKSYREVVAPARELIGADTGCVAASGLDRAQRALFAYYARARFIRLPTLEGIEARPTPASCNWLLVSDRESRPHDLQIVVAMDTPLGQALQAAGKPAQWTLIWNGQRRVNRGERLFLYAWTEAPMK